MITLLIATGYAVVLFAVRSVGSLLALFVFACLAYTAHIASFKYTLDDVYFFLMCSCVYAICARYMRKINESAWVGCVLMSLYSLFYSFDSWVNWDIETWTYTHHESIILIAHAVIMLLLSKIRVAMVYASLNLFWRNRCRRKDGSGNKNSYRGKKGKKGIA